MTFGHGTLARLWANGYDLRDYLQNVSGPATAAVEDATTLGKTSKVYWPGPTDAQLNLEGLFDGAAAASDEVLEVALGAAAGSIFTWLPQGDGFGYYGYGLQADETAYDVSAAAAAMARNRATAQSKVGRERGVVLHALAARSTTANGTASDNSAGTDDGGAGYLQVTAVTNSGGTVKIQHSTDNVTYVDLITFTASTAIGAQRIAVTGDVYRYTRAQWTIEADSSLTFHVLFGRK